MALRVCSASLFWLTSLWIPFTHAFIHSFIPTFLPSSLQPQEYSLPSFLLREYPSSAMSSPRSLPKTRLQKGKSVEPRVHILKDNSLAAVAEFIKEGKGKRILPMNQTFPWYNHALALILFSFHLPRHIPSASQKHHCHEWSRHLDRSRY